MPSQLLTCHRCIHKETGNRCKRKRFGEAYAWLPLTDKHPEHCPNCGSPYWDKPKEPS